MSPLENIDRQLQLARALDSASAPWKLPELRQARELAELVLALEDLRMYAAPVCSSAHAVLAGGPAAVLHVRELVARVLKLDGWRRGGKAA